MKIRTLAVQETSFLHLRDANDELLYEQTEDGKPDEGKPVGVTLYSPGTKIYAKAQAAKNNRLLDRLKKKGKSDMTAEETIRENATFLTACTKEWQNVEVEDLQGDALSMAVYSDTEIGFMAEQALKHLGAWENFTSGSTKT